MHSISLFWISDDMDSDRMVILWIFMFSGSIIVFHVWSCIIVHSEYW